MNLPPRRKYPVTNGNKNEWAALEKHQNEILNELSQIEIQAKLKKQVQYTKELNSQTNLHNLALKSIQKEKSKEREEQTFQTQKQDEMMKSYVSHSNQLKSIFSKDLDEQRRLQKISISNLKLQGISDAQLLKNLDNSAFQKVFLEKDLRKKREEEYKAANRELSESKRKKFEEEKINSSCTTPLLQSSRSNFLKDLTYRKFYSEVAKRQEKQAQSFASSFLQEQEKREKKISGTIENRIKEVQLKAKLEEESQNNFRKQMYLDASNENARLFKENTLIKIRANEQNSKEALERLVRDQDQEKEKFMQREKSFKERDWALNLDKGNSFGAPKNNALPEIAEEEKVKARGNVNSYFYRPNKRLENKFSKDNSIGAPVSPLKNPNYNSLSYSHNPITNPIPFNNQNPYILKYFQEKRNSYIQNQRSDSNS